MNLKDKQQIQLQFRPFAYNEIYLVVQGKNLPFTMQNVSLKCPLNNSIEWPLHLCTENLHDCNNYLSLLQILSKR